MVSASDKDQLRLALALQFEIFISVFSTFNDESVNKLFPSSAWTPSQVAAHIIKATDGVPDHNTAKADRSYDAMLQRIRPWWSDLNQKFNAPEQLLPGKEPRHKEEVMAELKRVCEKDLVIIATKDLSDICKDFELPTIGYLTRFEWLWFCEMHLRRHVFQLQKMQPAA